MFVSFNTFVLAHDIALYSNTSMKKYYCSLWFVFFYIDSQPIPSNIFIVAACNPHRSNSLATLKTETWVRSSYYVHQLHPTLQFVMWDYGSLDKQQETDYVNAKLKMLNEELPPYEVSILNLR